MSEHEQYAEDLALYALDALRGTNGRSSTSIWRLLRRARLELEQLRGDMALLAMSTAAEASTAGAARLWMRWPRERGCRGLCRRRVEAGGGMAGLGGDGGYDSVRGVG